MCPVYGPLTSEEVKDHARVENKSKTLEKVRPDFYKAMADLLTRLRVDYEKQLASDPDSIMFEGIRSAKTKTETNINTILSLRTKKIMAMAHRAATGSTVSTETMTPEEKIYYDDLVFRTKQMLLEIDHIRGTVKTVPTRLDDAIPKAAVKEPVKSRTVDEMLLEDDYPMEETFDDILEPELIGDDVPPLDEPPAVVPAEMKRTEEPIKTEPVQTETEEPAEEIADDAPEETAEDIPEEVPVKDIPETVRLPDTGNAVIRILEDLPPFVGPDREYSLVKEDVVTLPTAMAEALINAQKAAVIRPTP